MKKITKKLFSSLFTSTLLLSPLVSFSGEVSTNTTDLGYFVSEAFSAIYSLYIFAALIPGLSLCIRRVNDAGKRWTWIFINLIPLVGAIWFLFILCQPSIPAA